MVQFNSQNEVSIVISEKETDDIQDAVYSGIELLHIDNITQDPEGGLCYEVVIHYLRQAGITWDNSKRNIDYQELLRKYAQHVRDCEGIDFIDRLNSYESDVKFSEEEIVALEQFHKNPWPDK
jgi:hypothetical protein